MRTYNIFVGDKPTLLEEHEPGYWLGTAVLLGTEHHVELIAVGRDSDGVQIGENNPEDRETGEDSGENCDRYENVLEITGGEELQTVKLDIPGDDREYILVVTPHNR